MYVDEVTEDLVKEVGGDLVVTTVGKACFCWTFERRHAATGKEWARKLLLQSVSHHELEYMCVLGINRRLGVTRRNKEYGLRSISTIEQYLTI